LVLVERRQYQHLYIGPPLFDALGRRHAIHARHPQIHQDDARLELGSQLLRFVTVASLANYAQVTMKFEQCPQALAHQSRVRDEKYTNPIAGGRTHVLPATGVRLRCIGSETCKQLPPPGAGPNTSWPSSSATRSCSPSKP